MNRELEAVAKKVHEALAEWRGGNQLYSTLHFSRPQQLALIKLLDAQRKPPSPPATGEKG